jgi:alpha-L-rhamnosidase
MTSFNHYAYGAVGDFFYRRILGIEALSGGYATYQIQPVPGGGLQWAKGKASTPYGDILVHWEINQGEFRLEIHSPMECKGTVIMPDGAVHEIQTKCSTYVCKFA